MLTKIQTWVQGHWKAIMPVLASVVSSLVASQTEADTPGGWRTVILGAITSVLVYFKANQPAPPAQPGPAFEAEAPGAR